MSHRDALNLYSAGWTLYGNNVSCRWFFCLVITDLAISFGNVVVLISFYGVFSPLTTLVRNCSKRYHNIDTSWVLDEIFSWPVKCRWADTAKLYAATYMGGITHLELQVKQFIIERGLFFLDINCFANHIIKILVQFYFYI